MEGYKPAPYWEKRLREDFSIAGAGFKGWGMPFNRWLYKARERALNKFFNAQRINLADKKILDLGCGTGFYIDYYNRLGAKSVTGIDITQKSASALREKYSQYSFLKKDISSQLGLKEKFDIITAFDLLFHMVEAEKFEKAIENISGLCSESSQVLIFDQFLSKAQRYSEGHTRLRTLGEYKKALAKNNLRIARKIPIFYLLHPSNRTLAWRAAMSLNSKSKAFGFFLGALLYYCDALLLHLPLNFSHKLIVCKKLGA